MQEATARLSELIETAQSSGPQEIAMHGKSVAVVLSRESFDQLTQATDSLVDFIRRSPLYGLNELVFERDTSLNRETSL